MDCIVHGKGRPAGKHGYNGQPKENCEKTVREALVFATYWYGVVFKHVKSCDKCDPEEIARAYLHKRNVKHSGMVTGQVCKLILKYQKLAQQKKKPFDSQIAIQAIGQCQDVGILICYDEVLSVQQICSSLLTMAKRHVKRHGNSMPDAIKVVQKSVEEARADLRKSGQFRSIGHMTSEVAKVLPVVQNGKLTDKQLPNLLKVVEVHTA